MLLCGWKEAVQVIIVVIDMTIATKILQDCGHFLRSFWGKQTWQRSQKMLWHIKQASGDSF